MKIPQLQKKLELKSCHNITWEDNYSWVHQNNILEVLRDSSKLLPEVRKYLEEENDYTEFNLKDTKKYQKILFDEIKGRIKLDDESLKFKDIQYEYWSKTTTEGNYSIKLRKKLNSDKIELNSRIFVNKGDVLNVNSGINGRYNYLSVQGRIEAEEFWGSFSTYEPAVKGGFKGRKLQKGDVLFINEGTGNKSVSFSETVNSKKSAIRIVKAPEFHDFPEKDISLIVKKRFTVSLYSNRMGYQLDECTLEGTRTGNIISSGCIPGTIQVPSSGSPIVLMADSPTTGGYPRIGVIHPEDIGDFAQKLPGEMVKFKWFEV